MSRPIRRISAPIRIGRTLACLLVGGLLLSSLARLFDEATKAARLSPCMILTCLEPTRVPQAEPDLPTRPDTTDIATTRSAFWMVTLLA